MKDILPVFLSCQGFELSDGEKRLFALHNPLGVCLFAKGCTNIKNKVQVRKLVKQIQEVVERDDVLIAVDQEGGRVRRLLEPEWTKTASQSEILTPEMAELHAQLISYDLKSSGINVNFAPVLDVEYENTSAALKGRCFGSNSKEIAKLGKTMVETYEKCGICPCVKHLPGHGRGKADPHLQLPMIDADMKALENDFFPFKELKNAPMGMVAHLVLQKIDAHNPSSCSAILIHNIIREHIGFSGLLVSDAIMMNALSGTISERAERCYDAGCDAICLGNADFAANEELCRCNLKLTDEAHERLNKIREIIKQDGLSLDYQKLQKKYCAEVKNIIPYNSEYDATEVLSRLREKKGESNV